MKRFAFAVALLASSAAIAQTGLLPGIDWNAFWTASGVPFNVRP